MRVKRMLFAAVCGVGLSTGLACSDSTGGGGYGGGGGGGGGGGATGGHTTSISVGASGNSFSPKNDTVSVGATITWTWSNGPHTVTFESTPDSSAEKNSGTFMANFNTTGTFRYRCLVHSGTFTSGMVGTITVQ